jgi:Ca2+-binding EF-hand superfamily protein
MSTFKKEKAPLKPTRKARNELTEEQKQEIKEAFDLFDTDGVGTAPLTQDTSTRRS